MKEFLSCFTESVCSIPFNVGQYWISGIHVSYDMFVFNIDLFEKDMLWNKYLILQMLAQFEYKMYIWLSIYLQY